MLWESYGFTIRFLPMFLPFTSENLHHLIWEISHFLQGFIHVEWLFGISENQQYYYALFQYYSFNSITIVVVWKINRFLCLVLFIIPVSRKKTPTKMNKKNHPPHQVLLPPWYPPGSSSKPFEASLDLAQQLGLANRFGRPILGVKMVVELYSWYDFRLVISCRS